MPNSSTDPSFFHQAGTWLRNKFLAGLFVVLPIAATVWLINLLYNLINGPFDQVVRALVARDGLPMSDYFQKHHDGTIPGAGFILTLLLILMIGVLAGNFFGRQVLLMVEHILARIPLINSVYFSLKQAIEALKGTGQEAGKPKFSQVVYVPMPGSEANLIGFVTGEFVNPFGVACSQVFVPNSPAPYAGFLLVIPNDKLVKADMTVEQATRSILSIGLVAPIFSPTTPTAPPPGQLDTKQTG
jgi:uncharacterized membrane protein